MQQFDTEIDNSQKKDSNQSTFKAILACTAICVIGFSLGYFFKGGFTNNSQLGFSVAANEIDLGTGWVIKLEGPRLGKMVVLNVGKEEKIRTIKTMVQNKGLGILPDYQVISRKGGLPMQDDTTLQENGVEFGEHLDFATTEPKTVEKELEACKKFRLNTDDGEKAGRCGSGLYCFAGCCSKFDWCGPCDGADSNGARWSDESENHKTYSSDKVPLICKNKCIMEASQLDKVYPTVLKIKGGRFQNQLVHKFSNIDTI